MRLDGLLKLNDTTEATTGGAGSLTTAGGGFFAKSLVSTGTFQLATAARTSGVASYFTVTTPADTGLTAATESIGVNFATGTRTWADGTVATQREFRVSAPTYNKTTTAATFTKAATFAISAAPIAGAGVTITNPYAFWVQAGVAQFDGSLTMAADSNSAGVFATFSDIAGAGGRSWRLGPGQGSTGVNCFSLYDVTGSVVPFKINNSGYANFLDTVEAAGNFLASTIGKTLAIKSGANAKAGTFTLVAGTATVANTSITDKSVIAVTNKPP